MNERMIDISSPARLSIQSARLVIACQDHDETAIPLDEIAAVVVSNARVTFTHAVLSGLAETGTIFIVCDQKHLPAGMLLPLQTHHVQREVFELQATMKLPVRKRLWKQIVQAKVRAQAALLRHVSGSSCGLEVLEGRVRTGDPTNIEAQAAKRYWSALLGRGFRRDADGGQLNSHLNYGYAILRGIVCRGACAAGLHPSLSLHHHNRYDAFALADDLMEPLRPLVDFAVWTLAQTHAPGDEFSREDKRHLLAAMAREYPYRKNESRTLFDISSRMASSLVRVIRERATKLQLPACWQFSACQS